MITRLRKENNSVSVNHKQKGKQNMPLGKDVSKNMSELARDNRKKGSERGAGGKPRSREQMIAISLSAAGKSKPRKFRMRKES